MSLTFQRPEKPELIRASNGHGRHTALVHDHVLAEPSFLDAIRRERRRSERSGKPFVLMLVRLQESSKNGHGNWSIQRVALAVHGSVRETDTMGWFQEGKVLGVIF